MNAMDTIPMKNTAQRYGKRATARLRAIRCQAKAWQRTARRAITFMLIAGCVADMPSRAFAQQMGQSAMAPAGGVVNRAVAGLQDLNANGPGLFYYGINAADQGLGYNGSYMTFGGFIPYAEDDLGGFWSADIRSHLSGYGGFFSNVGFVRKQFIGGAIGGIGVYWDYDGDQNQYPLKGSCGTGQLGQFGHTYNQVGISGEFLTDFGNLRSNGYIPVGTTAYTAGAIGSSFYQNYAMCQYGLDAALAGADLEVGAYIPGLSDWAGMVSVGGYAYGNTQSQWSHGTQANQAVVPYFGGVYTRLDMTFLENWDFSLQYNNDSVFDSTGFARLTYRMGGSRRRNVPDQMEQPMMRNEHIVREHKTPEVAINPATGTPWKVIHVNNAVATSGNGSDASPVKTLAEASAIATNAWDIVFVHQGLSRTTTPYGGTFDFGNQNQYLVGDGAGFALPSVCCVVNLSTGAGFTPLLSNPAGPSILIDGTIAGGARIANLATNGSGVGIAASGNLTSSFRDSEVSNVMISGNNSSADQTGVFLNSASGTITFADTSIANMPTNGFFVLGGDANVKYQGAITSGTANTGGAAGPLIEINNTTGGKVDLAIGSAPAGSTVANAISDTGGEGIIIQNNNTLTKITIDNVSLQNNKSTAIRIDGDASDTQIFAGTGTGIVKNTGGSAIAVEGGSPTFAYVGGISNSNPADGSPSYLLSVALTTSGNVSVGSNTASLVDTANGIQLTGNTDSNIQVLNAQIASVGPQGLYAANNTNSGSSTLFEFLNIDINAATSAGVYLDANTQPMTFSNLNINLLSAGAAGFQARNSTGIITTNFGNTIATASTTQPAVMIESSTIDMNLLTVNSGLTNGGAVKALQFLTTSTGTFAIGQAFTVGGTKGTNLDVLNTSAGPVGVSLPPP